MAFKYNASHRDHRLSSQPSPTAKPFGTVMSSWSPRRAAWLAESDRLSPPQPRWNGDWPPQAHYWPDTTCALGHRTDRRGRDFRRCFQPHNPYRQAW